MAFKEVTQLRKNGQLAEALQMAKADLELEQNNWTYSALFWVYNDMCKLAIEQNQMPEAQTIVERMESIFQYLNDNEGFANNVINLLKKKLIPHASEMRQAEEMSRDPERVSEAYNIICNIFNTNELSTGLHTQFGWIIYRYVREQISRRNVLEVKQALSKYLRLEVERPSLLHSLILRMAIELEHQFQTEFKFTRFFELWGFNQFREEDWTQGEGENGIRFNSTVEHAICKYATELKDDKIHSVPEEFMDLLNTAIQKYGKPLYNYYKARILAQSEHKEEALSLYRQLVASMGQAYLWNDIAEIIGDPQLKKAAICKYILSQRDEKFLGNSHLKLAAILIGENMFSEALYELNTYCSACKANGYHIKQEYHHLLCSIPSNIQPAPNNKLLYQTNAQHIENFIFSDSPIKYFVLTDVYTAHERIKAKLMSNSNDSVGISAKQLRKDKTKGYHKFYSGRMVDVEGRKKVIGLSPVSEETAVNLFPLVKIENNISIKLNRHGKQFGFVEDCYIHERFIKQIPDGAKIKVYAITKEDGKKQAIIVDTIS